MAAIKKHLVPIGLRVPADLAAWLKAEAQQNQRSVANQTAWSLQQYRQHQENCLPSSKKEVAQKL